MSDDATIRGNDAVLAHTVELFREFTPPGIELELPPPSAKAFDLRFVEYVPGRSLTATAAVSKQFANAVGLLQGGFLSAMFDNLIGPLSYLTARGPTTTLELTTHFLRPVFPGEQLRLQAAVRKAGSTTIFIGAEAHNAKDKLVATAVSTVQVLPKPTS
ncbi:PaaI family thioesterase [Nocardia harenae]|uniref:PaaI family thioesterase n=1 Tax=Nocardia harenae TaxID=358707 RepID=UPI0008339CA8|nr:PaaI family thioesterase [Nocardia harenae]